MNEFNANGEYITDYAITVLQPSPSLQLDKFPFRGTFAEAVEEARAKFATLGDEYSVKRVRVACKYGVTRWFDIDGYHGYKETNYNTGAKYRVIEGAE